MKSFAVERKSLNSFFSVFFFCCGFCFLSGCVSRGYEDAAFDRLVTRELARFSEPSEDTSFSSASLSVFFQRIVDNDPELQQLRYDLEKKEVQEEQGRSLLLPDIDIVAGVNMSGEGDDGWESNPELGLVLRYDFNRAIFQQDYSAVAAAEKKLIQNRILLKEKELLHRVHLLLGQYYHKKRMAENCRVLVQKNEELLGWYGEMEKVLPGGTGLDHEQILDEIGNIRREQSYLEEELNRIRKTLEYKSGGSPVVEKMIEEYRPEFLRLVAKALQEADEKRLSDLLVESLQNNLLFDTFRARIFVARMKKLQAQRELLPKARGSVGGGSLLEEGSEGTNDFVLKLELSYSLFDGGRIASKVRLQDINLRKAETDISEGVRKQGFHLKQAEERLAAAGRRLELTRSKLARKNSRLAAVRDNNFAEGRLGYLLKKEQLQADTLLAGQELELAEAAMTFILYSGLRFPFSPTDTGRYGKNQNQGWK